MTTHGRETDHIDVGVACLRTANMPLTLISTHGFHCEVWRSVGRLIHDGESVDLDFVVKNHREPCGLAQVRVYARDHRRLREALGDIAPEALFVATRVDGEPGVVAMAQTCTPWFNLANARNEEEALPMLRHMPRAADELRRFVAAALAWREDEPARIIDLHGDDNLILDREYRVRYIDSFGVFFYPDVAHAVDAVDEDLLRRIDISMARLDYLQRLLNSL